ncbi:bifunctional transcriptional activator/DNA repair enzyme AdaA [Taibaiella koreensis]|uniref:bifunctional transcriptional activator/DNA repair enzyme AdaA n=1 Tax=Taibaiella koreensis TaxID=1268548 RepID=UPI000E59EA28|nr:methylated-DNA--[protein]-cysteine S-methyltransferase [Taibaiella koreensis]
MLTDDIMYEAILAKDIAYEGSFVTAVKTTGIFCRPTCTARKPKRENVVFYKTIKEALTHGYRPCKVCRPLEQIGEVPAGIAAVLQAVQADPSRKLKDEDLRHMGVEPSLIRRWFLRHHSITFQAYQRMYRINTAFHKIQEGAGVTSAAFDAGFESLSGFTQSFKSVFGVSPGKSKVAGIIQLSRLETPLGPMIACAVSEGICLLEFADRKMLETELKDISRLLRATIVPGDSPHFDILRKELKAYFEGKLKVFTVALSMPGTVFQQKIWHALREVPYGHTSTYKRQAGVLGITSSIRAVAHANGMNRISIIVPCHRVLGSDGSLTGYGGGLHRKQWLLEHERNHS